jgi:hypothetical protein
VAVFDDEADGDDVDLVCKQLLARAVMIGRAARNSSSEVRVTPLVVTTMSDRHVTL